MADHKTEAEQAATAGKWDIANYHATMWHAEQQRVGNLLAWLGDGPLSEINELREGQIAIQRQIVDGLGLA